MSVLMSAGCQASGQKGDGQAALSATAHPPAALTNATPALDRAAQAPVAAAPTAASTPAPTPEAAAAAAPSTPPLGLNLGGVSYYATAIPFVDAMKMADPFLSTEAPGSVPEPHWDTELADKIPRDENGYPLEAPTRVTGVSTPQVLRASVVSALYGGHYVVLYDGEGELAFPASPATVISAKPGRVDLDVKVAPGENLFVAIVRSSPNNHVRNIRVLLPGFEQSYAKQVFHPTFLARLNGVGALRFMDWGATNGHPHSQWSERTRPTEVQGGNGGVAYEYMIDLANRVDADAWFCVPHKADNAYVDALAKLIKTRLNPKHKAYIEYSNELWNGIFPQSKWVSEQGCKAGLNKLGQYSGSCEEDGPRYWAGIKWNARRSGEIFQIFDRAFAGETQRLVHVLAGQAGHDHLNQVLLDAFANKAINTAATRADALAIAPYLGASLASDLVEQGKTASITVPAILDKLDTLVQSEVADVTRTNAGIAKKHGLRLIAYEGGQHLVAYGDASNNQAFVDKLIAANRNPRMRGIYTRMLDAWYANSGDGLLVLFNFAESPTKYGAWGLLEGQEQAMSQAPKYQAFFDRLQRLSARTDKEKAGTTPAGSAH